MLVDIRTSTPTDVASKRNWSLMTWLGNSRHSYKVSPGGGGKY